MKDKPKWEEALEGGNLENEARDKAEELSIPSVQDFYLQETVCTRAFDFIKDEEVVHTPEWVVAFAEKYSKSQRIVLIGKLQRASEALTDVLKIAGVEDEYRNEDDMYMGVPKAIGQLTKAHAEAVAEKLNEREWKGYVTAVSTEDVTISSGNQVGLQTGNIFSVYDVKVIEGAGGHNFIVPGLKTGEIILTKVSAGQSRATLISGDGIREGSSIKQITP